LGSVDAPKLLKKGEWSAQIGLIQQANGGVLYIDEVNLLPDHLVDSILDSSSGGQHRIEREGLSESVDADYILIGSMNPEEGDLRPQLNDRFTHGIMVRDDFSVEQRRDIVKLRMEFDDDPELFLTIHQRKLDILKKQIVEVRGNLKNVEISEDLRDEVAKKAKTLNLEGIRAELGVLRTVRCAAAWRGETVVSNDDLEEAWTLCLGHRKDSSQPKNQKSKSDKKFPNSLDEKSGQSKLQFPKTSVSPSNAIEEKIVLKSTSNLVHEELLEWWQCIKLKQLPNSSLTRTSESVLGNFPSARLCWHSSLKASVVRGWTPGKPWYLKYSKSARRNNFWLFLDASRSTGAINFLNAARDAIQTLGAKTYRSRFFVLVLQNGELSWWIKRGTAQAFTKSLDKLLESSGKSYLSQALNQLYIAVKKQGVLPGDRLLFCSDGMFSTENGESISESKKRFRKELRSLSEKVCNLAWLHPNFLRGMRHWLPELVKGTVVRLIALDNNGSQYK